MLRRRDGEPMRFADDKIDLVLWLMVGLGLLAMVVAP